MADLLLGVGVWLGVSFVAVLMFALGAALGRRGAWEEGYNLGLRAGQAQAQAQRQQSGQHRRAG